MCSSVSPLFQEVTCKFINQVNKAPQDATLIITKGRPLYYSDHPQANNTPSGGGNNTVLSLSPLLTTSTGHHDEKGFEQGELKGSPIKLKRKVSRFTTSHGLPLRIKKVTNRIQ
ncbi:hypothetical protein ACTXT7_011090 [Hymenolepis weldensis]